MGDWAKDKKQVWEKIRDKYGGNKEAFDWGTWGFFDWATGKAWPTLSSLSKARSFGWTRYDDTFETWVETFRAFENAGILPPRRKVNAEPANTLLPNLNGHAHGETKTTSTNINPEITKEGKIETEAPSIPTA